MPDFIDQTGHRISLSQIPRRIISLVPSQTELLADLDLQEEVIGITKFCVHPEKWFRAKTRVGGTKQIKPDLIRHLHPDLILANKEENVKDQIIELRNDFPVWVSDVYDISSALEMINQVGALTGKVEQSETLIKKIEKSFLDMPVNIELIPAAYLIWREPYMTVGGDTFIHAMMEKAGFSNIFAGMNRYPEVNIEQLSHCRVLLLSSEPFPFKESHQFELQQQLPHTKIQLVDGEMFSWFGSRMQFAAEYFNKLRSA